jgi:hypothetical protein
MTEEHYPITKIKLSETPIQSPIIDDEEEAEENDDDIPESWKVPYIDPDDFHEQPEEPIVPIESLPEVSKFEGLDQTPEWVKQKNHDGKNMKGIKKEMRF